MTVLAIALIKHNNAVKRT